MAVRVELTAAKEGGATDAEHAGTRWSDRMASDASGRDMAGDSASSEGMRDKRAGGAPHVEWGTAAAAASITSGSTDRVARKRTAMTGVRGRKGEGAVDGPNSRGGVGTGETRGAEGQL